MNCPICSSIEKKDQPYSGLHAYTIIFECGCEIIQPINDNSLIYEQRCDEEFKPKLDLNKLFEKHRKKS